MAPGNPLRRSELRRGKWNRNAWEQWSKVEERAHAGWKGAIVKRRCEVCVRAGRVDDRSRLRDAHHILPKQHLRRFVRSMRLPAEEAKSLLIALLYDRRNGMCLCRRCHDNHESAFERVPRAAIPARAFVFSEELGLAYVLDRLYPS